MTCQVLFAILLFAMTQQTREAALFGIDPAKYRPHEIPVYGAALVYRLMETHVSKYLGKFGLSPIKFNVLAVIEFQSEPEGISQVEISKKAIVTPSNIARLLERMEKEGLVLRASHPRDRRINLVKNTPKARELLDLVWPDYQKLIKKLSDQITAGEQEQLSRILAKWFMNLKANLPRK